MRTWKKAANVLEFDKFTALAKTSLRIPGQDFVVAPFIGQNIGEDQNKNKKRSSLQNELVFSPKVCDDQKTQNKVFAYQSVGFRSQKKKTQMVSPQNGDTRGRPPPPPPLATPLRSGTNLQFPRLFRSKRQRYVSTFQSACKNDIVRVFLWPAISAV